MENIDPQKIESSEWERKKAMMGELIKNKHFVLGSSEKTREMSGKAWFRHPLGQKMDGMYIVDEKGDVFELDFRKEDFIGSIGEENRFFADFQEILEANGFKLCALNSDLQKAATIEEEISKN